MRADIIPLTLTLALVPLAAQDVGNQAPELQFVKTYGFEDMPQVKLSDFRGTVVLLEFWQTTSAPCRRLIPYLNELQAKYARRGLVVVGVTDEPAEKVDAYVDRREINYPIALTVLAPPAPSDGAEGEQGKGEGSEADGKEARYEVKEVPYAFLIDQTGKLVWRGNPARFDTGRLDALLAGARPATVRAGLEDVYLLRSGGQLGQAYELATKLRERGKLSAAAQAQAQAWCDADTALVASIVAEADAAEKEKDIYRLWSRLDLLSRQYEGIPGAETAGKRLEQLMASKQNQEEIEAGHLFAQAEQLEQLLDYDGAIAAYLELSRSHRRTRAGKDARIKHRDLLKAGMLGFDARCVYCKAGGKACPTHQRKR